MSVLLHSIQRLLMPSRWGSQRSNQVLRFLVTAQLGESSQLSQGTNNLQFAHLESLALAANEMQVTVASKQHSLCMMTQLPFDFMTLVYVEQSRT